MASETTTVRRLRALIVVMFGLGVVAAILGSDSLRLFLCCSFVPGAGAYVKPRWPAIAIWMMWASTFGMLGVLLALGGNTDWFGTPSYWLIGVIGALLFIGLPLVRRTGDAPPVLGGRRIPEARVHRQSRR